MLFTLKKIVGGLLLPLPALLLLIGIGIALLWFSRFQRTGKLCVSLGWLLLTLLSLQPVADSLLKPIEDTYPTWRGEQPVNYVVVLGGGYTWNPEWAPSSNLINNSLPRLTEGIRLWQANPGSKMIFTGAAAKTNPVSTAEAGARVAESLGVPRSDIIVLDRPKDTEEEALEARHRRVGPSLSVLEAFGVIENDSAGGDDIHRARFPTWRGEQPVSYVVVLGGGYTWNPEWAPSSNLISNSLPRLTEGIRLWQENPGSKMIFTGAAAKTNPVSTAEAGARVAESLGVPRSDIIVLDKPKDTEEEALAVKGAIGDAPFLLVTSASHLPRAMIFFRHAGLDPLPAPANQLAVTSPLNPWERAIPSPVWLMHSDRVGYETLGRVWQWLKGSSGEPGQE